MRFIPTRIHGVLDYLMGAVLIVAPWVLGFNQGGAETWVPVVLGSGVILYSLFTDYELGLVKSLSMRTHLMLDFVGGAMLAASPWLFGFSEVVYVPHLILGIAEMAASLFTKQFPATMPDHSSSVSTDSFTERQVRSGTTPSSRPPMGSNADMRSRSESKKSRRELE